MSEVFPKECVSEDGSQVVLFYDTWGSFGQYSRAIAILRNGVAVFPEKLRVRYMESRVVNLQGVEVTVVNKNSRKNQHITVFIPRQEVLAVIRDTKTSSGWGGFKLFGPGTLVEEEIVEEKVEGNKKHTTTFAVCYYVNGDLKIELARERVETKTELIGLPLVRVYVNPWGILEVKGDTYPVRDTLKQLGLVWDSLKKAWVPKEGRLEPSAARELAEKIKEALQGLAEVEVKA